jgi:TetR/AcrR family transcriptional regulator, acrAB operon repressor
VAPRGYTLKRRAETTAATRRRILDAAIELYLDRGIDATTLTAIAKRADVARGTVIHHFGSGEGVLGESLDHLLGRLELPDERILDGVVGWEARVRVFVDAMIAFQERSTPWWTAFESEMQRPALQAREVAYWESFERLLRAALGPELAAEPRAGAVVVALTHPSTAGSFAWTFERAGLPQGDAREFLVDLTVKAVREIEMSKGKGGRQ